MRRWRWKKRGDPRGIPEFWCCLLCDYRLPRIRGIGMEGRVAGYECMPCRVLYILLATGDYDYRHWWPRPVISRAEVHEPQVISQAPPEGAEDQEPMPRTGIPASVCLTLSLAELVRAGVFNEGPKEPQYKVRVEPAKKMTTRQFVFVRVEAHEKWATLKFDGEEVGASARRGTNVGGRWWTLNCPGCLQPCRKLYKPVVPRTGWKCRKCYQIVYPSRMPTRPAALPKNHRSPRGRT